MKLSIMTYIPINKIRMVIVVATLLFTVSLLTACAPKSKAGIVIAGSTSVQPFAEVLAEEYMIIHPELTIDIQGGGSSAGIKTVQSGTANIGMSSRGLKDDEKKLWSIEIARDGLAVIIHPSNPIVNLTLNQIRDIYASTLTSWNQLGGANSKIHVITREEGSGTRSAFESLVMSKSEITPRAIVQDSNGAVLQLVEDDPNAIGFISLGLVNKSVKALNLDGIAATRENVINGSYNLSRPFLFLSDVEPTGQSKEFIDYIMSAEGQKQLAKEGLVPSAGGISK